jgi:hypothetical protein
MALNRKQILEAIEQATKELVKNIEEAAAKRREASDRLAKLQPTRIPLLAKALKATTASRYAAGLRSQAAQASRAGGDFEARHLRVSADMAERDANPFTSPVAPSTPSGPSSAKAYADQLRLAAKGAEAARNPTEAAQLRASAARAEQDAAAYATMREALAGPARRVTVEEWAAGGRQSLDTALQKVEVAQQELDEAQRNGVSAGELARLRNALAAAQLGEKYARR